MKLITLAACAVAIVAVMALFVHVTPGDSVAEPQNMSVVVGPSTAADRIKPSTPMVNTPVAKVQAPQSDLSFNGVAYFHRSSQSNERMDIHEFTPVGQSDLSAWTDMVSVIHYRDVKDADGLAEIGNLLLSMYESVGGQILVTRSVPATDDTLAEHLLVGVLFDREIVEAVFNRLILHDGTGTNVMVSRRVYGHRVGDEMSDWLRANGPATEEQLMSLDTGAIISAIPRQKSSGVGSAEWSPSAWREAGDHAPRAPDAHRAV